ncbi:hypothetical protein NC651_036758 [Populus alba x Populus x berolinensis]|nr:hypothetical protein NC651_036758 [Populus alba x Populus x berolinensis]
MVWLMLNWKLSFRSNLIHWKLLNMIIKNCGRCHHHWPLICDGSGFSLERMASCLNHILREGKQTTTGLGNVLLRDSCDVIFVRA